MTRDEAATEVAARMKRHRKDVTLEEVRQLLWEKYPRDGYRTVDEPNRDYAFGPADVLEMERELRRRLKV